MSPGSAVQSLPPMSGTLTGHVACAEVIPVVTLLGEGSGQEESREMRTVKPAQGTSL